MNDATSSRPRIEIAASWRAAIQPSVLASSVSTSAPASARPIRSLRYAAASSVVKRRSAARTSTSSPAGTHARERQRRVGPGEDDQVDLGRQVVEQEREALADLAAPR